jgi:hypothetical protein
MKTKVPLTSWKRSTPPSPAEKATADLLRVAGEPDGLSPEAHARIARRLREPPKRRLLPLPDVRVALAAGGLALALIVASASVVLFQREPSAWTSAPAGQRLATAPMLDAPVTAPEGRLTTAEPAPAELPPEALAEKESSKKKTGAKALAKAEARLGDSAAQTGGGKPLLAAAPPDEQRPHATATLMAPPTAAPAAPAATRERSEDDRAEPRDDAFLMEGGGLPPLPTPERCVQLLRLADDLHDPKALVDRARCRLQAGQGEAGRADLQRYLELQPNGRYAAAARALLSR